MQYRNLIVSGIVLVCLAFIGYSVYDYYKIPDSPEGDRVTELTYPGVDGQPISISSLKGNIVLIDFWASWCPPCRAENPKLVQLYQQYHSRKFKTASGFEIYSISLDMNHASWVRAIESDGLVWRDHVSDLRGWNSDAAQRFGVRSIPSNILIDENGEIIGRNLTAGEIGDALKKREAAN